MSEIKPDAHKAPGKRPAGPAGSTAFAMHLALMNMVRQALQTTYAGRAIDQSKPLKRSIMVTTALSRPVANIADTVELLGELTNVSAQGTPVDLTKTLQELGEIQATFARQCFKMNQDWFKGLQQLTTDYLSVREGTTLSKTVEQEYNAGAQFQALVVSQITDALDLIERTSVGYGYWLSHKYVELQKAQSQQSQQNDAQDSKVVPFSPATAA